MNETHRNKRLEKAQLKVLFTTPFFAPGVAKLPVIWDSSIPTACTNGEKIWWNPEWFDSLKDEVLPTVLCHETAHCLLGHLWRLPPGGEMETWNIAIDHATNNMLKEFGEQVVAKRLADPFPMPDGNICCDPKYRDRSEEDIFAELAANQPPGVGGSKPPSGQGSGKGGSGKNGGSGGSKPGQGNPSANAGQANRAGSGRKDPFGEIVAPRGTAAQAKQKQADWQNTLLQSAAAAKGRGDMPGSVQRLIEEIMHPKVPWVDLLRTWLREKAEDDWNFMKPNRYFDGEFMLPSLDSERMGTVIFATDTSGSIDQTVLAQFQAEKQACLDDMKPGRLVDICCDARIQSEKEYRVGEQISKEAPGGGGTSFVPVFERLAEMTEKPKLVVYLTDLDGAFPDEEPDYPVLWLTYNAKGKTAPFGEVVEVE